MSASFTHIINPFPAKPESEHAVASAITYASLERAVADARAGGLEVEVRAVVLPGDEGAIQAPATLAGRLSRTVQDLRTLRPVRPLPLVKDVLEIGAKGAATSHLIYTNMDIAVQPDFYLRLDRLIQGHFDDAVPFIVYRRNIDKRFSNPSQLEEMYAAPGTVAHGYDCFVFPRAYLDEIDVGNCCIGSAHFDYLLFMSLDAVSGFRAARVQEPALTFHVGNDLAWGALMDYIEYNLEESLAAIARMRAKYDVPAQSVFAGLERHFRRNTRIDSWFLRKAKRVPAVGEAVQRIKRFMGRTY